jgi:PAS domain-containing protein
MPNDVFGRRASPGEAFAQLLMGSYATLMGTEIILGSGSPRTAAGLLYSAPFGLLAQDMSPDPVFVFANLTAQKLFGYSWDEFIGMPSRLSAGEQDRQARQDFMDSVRRRGYADGYRGLRVAKSGRGRGTPSAPVSGSGRCRARGWPSG